MLSNNELKLLRNLSGKRYREKHGLFIAEGLKLVSEAVQSSFKIRDIFCLSEAMEEVVALEASLKPREIPLHQLKEVTQQVNPAGVLALVELPKQQPTLNPEEAIILLDGIRDPGNLGTILRSADWFGVQQVLCSNDCVELYNPKVVQSTMGSIFRMKVNYADLPAQLDQWSAAGNEKFHVSGAALEGEVLSQNGLSATTALVIGSESHGIRPEVMKRCDSLVRIPGGGETESLNASVAASVLLYNWTSLQN